MKHLGIISIILISFSVYLQAEWSVGVDSRGNLLLGYISGKLHVSTKFRASYHKSVDDYIDAYDLEEEFFYCTPGIEFGYINNYHSYSMFPFIGIEKQFPIYVKTKGYIDNTEQKKYLCDVYDDYFFSTGVGITSAISKRINIGIQFRVKIHPSKIKFSSGSIFTSKYIYTDNTIYLSFNL